MISRSGKGNFLADHYDWLAAGVGVLALIGAGVFCFVGTDVEAELDEAAGGLESRPSAASAVADADMKAYDAMTNVSKAVELARRIEEKYVGRLASEKRVFCDKTACGRAIPEKYDADKNLVCIFCGATQKVSQVAKVLDADGDGMPDVWEKKHGLNPSDPGDANADTDGDGFTNLEELAAKTDPRDAKDHPDYLDSLSLVLPLKKTYMPFLLVSATPIPSGWRCEFFDPSRKDDYGRRGLSMTAVVGEEIGKSGFVLKNFEKKSVKKSIKGSVNQKEVDVSEAVVERKDDGKRLTLTMAENKKAKLAPIDVQATLSYSRGGVRQFDVIAGGEIVLNGTKYKVLDIKETGKGGSVVVENILTGAKRTLEALEP